MATLLVQRLACSGQRLHEQSADLRRQSAADDHHAVLVLIHVQRPARVAPGGLPRLGLPVHAAPAANDPLDVRGGAGPTHRQQPRFGLGSGHAGQRPHLGVRELAPGESPGQQRQRAQGVRDADALAGRARVESHSPGQPGCTGAEAGVPTTAGVELANQVQKVRSGGLDVRRQLGDLITQLIQLGGRLQGGGNVGRADFHERVPLPLGRLYTLVFEPPWYLQDGRSRRDP